MSTLANDLAAKAFAVEQAKFNDCILAVVKTLEKQLGETQSDLAKLRREVEIARANSWRPSNP